MPNPGAYLACGNETFGTEIYYNSSVWYHENSLNTVWKTTNQSNLNVLPNVCYFDAYYKYNAIGRLQMSNYTILGKVFYRSYTSRDGFHGWNPVTKSYFQLGPSDEFEVLCNNL